MSRAGRVLCGLSLLAGVACTPAAAPIAPAASGHPAASFELDRAELSRGGASPALIAKLEASRFRYFRMLAEPFELRACEAFADRRTALPTSAVHGDAHLEQFVVTAETFGLEDFDRSGFGPVVVDTVRYAASIHLACKDAKWACDADAAVERFLVTWRAALESEPTRGGDPAVVGRLRAKTPQSRAAWLAWADELTGPLSPADEAQVRTEWAKFGAAMRRIQPDRPSTSLDLVRLGGLTMGFGSALERKALLRVAGETASENDDIVIEVRQGAPPDAQGCVWRATYGESLVLMFHALLGRRVPDVHGFVPLFGGRRYWVQSWDPGYQEVTLADIGSQAELEELVVDAAVQLGGHLWVSYPASLRAYQADAQREAFDATRADVVTLARQLADEVDSAWRRFGSPRR